jgi:hypothetical protein
MPEGRPASTRSRRPASRCHLHVKDLDAVEPDAGRLLDYLLDGYLTFSKCQ